MKVEVFPGSISAELAEFLVRTGKIDAQVQAVLSEFVKRVSEKEQGSGGPLPLPPPFERQIWGLTTFTVPPGGEGKPETFFGIDTELAEFLVRAEEIDAQMQAILLALAKRVSEKR